MCPVALNTVPHNAAHQRRLAEAVHKRLVLTQCSYNSLLQPSGAKPSISASRSRKRRRERRRLPSCLHALLPASQHVSQSGRQAEGSRGGSVRWRTESLILRTRSTQKMQLGHATEPVCLSACLPACLPGRYTGREAAPTAHGKAPNVVPTSVRAPTPRRTRSSSRQKHAPSATDCIFNCFKA